MVEVEAEEVIERSPEFWNRTSPTAAAKLIERAKSRIEFDLGEHYEFVRALATIKSAIPAVRWRRILDKLEPVVWMSCLDGPDWDPRVLSNGGVAIRNFHRVLGIDLDNGISVSGVRPIQIRLEAETVLRRASGRSESGVVFMHHGPDGVIYPQRIPDECVFCGQSLLFTPARLVNDLGVLGASGATGEEPLIFRLFQDTVCVYSPYRHNDDADTVLERFAVTRSDCDPDAEFSLNRLLDADTAWPEFAGWISEDIDEHFADYQVPASLQGDFRALMSADVPHSWARQLFEILNQFPPLFSKTPSRPPMPRARSTLPLSRRARSLFFMEGDVAALRVRDLIGTLGIQGAKWMANPKCKDVAAIDVPFRNLAEARQLAAALAKRFGPVWLTVPHLGLDHREGRGRKKGNGAWFGFGGRNRVLTQNKSSGSPSAVH